VGRVLSFAAHIRYMALWDAHRILREIVLLIADAFGVQAGLTSFSTKGGWVPISGMCACAVPPRSSSQPYPAGDDYLSRSAKRWPSAAI
jgi:hypothetical protein